MQTYHRWEIAKWCEANLYTEKKEKLDFTKFPFLPEIYNDTSRDIVIKKCSQVGVSTLAMNKLLWLAYHIEGLTAIYTMPRSDDVSDFSQARFNTVTRDSGVFSKVDIDNVGLKKINGLSVYFRGTWTDIEALSVPSDFNIVDELNFSKMQVVEAYEERLSASGLGWRLKISHPTIPSFGISTLYEQSNKKQWHVKCEQGHEQPITEGNIIDEEYRCIKCKALLNRSTGRWIATAKSKENIQGYHLSQLVAPWISARDIIRKKDNYEYKRDYYNFVLGEEFAGGDMAITRADIIAVEINSSEVIEPSSAKTSIGVDWGDTTWAVVLRGQTIIYAEKITGDTREHPIRVLELMEKYNAVAICDFGYGDTKNKFLIEKKPSAVYMCVYVNNKLYPEFDKDKNIVRIDRETSLYEVCETIKNKKLKIVRVGEINEDLTKHFLSLHKTKVTDAQGGVREKFTRTGDDHLVHALNYARLWQVRGQHRDYSKWSVISV